MKKTPVLFLLLLLYLIFIPSVFAQEMEPEDVVFSYFETLYSAYLKNDPIDSSGLFDLDSDISANFVNSFKMLMERRAYIKEKDYVYVETRRFPLDIDIEEVYIDGDDATVVFYLEGNPKLAYPTFIYLGRNIFWLTREEEGWKIYDRRHATIDFHNENEEYSEPKLSYEESVDLLKKSIDHEFYGRKAPRHDFLFPAFGPKKNPLNYTMRSSDYIYDPTRALWYIDEFIFDRNPQFASLQENCANFASQILYYGFFGDEYPYIGAWNSYDGDFTESWIYVGDLMDYMTHPRGTEDSGPRSEIPKSIYGLRLGGIIEVKSEAGESYAHTMELMDYQKMIFSGNNYDGFRYYSDLLSYKRFYNPLFFRL